MGNKLNGKSKYDYEPISAETVSYTDNKCRTCPVINNKYKHINTCPKSPLTVQCSDCEWHYGMATLHDVKSTNCIYYKKNNFMCYICSCLGI